MAKSVRAVQTERLVVISPSDVREERLALMGVVQELNRTVARAYQVHLELWTWEMDAFPGFHNLGPQGLIDELLVENDPDIVVGIFWRRIGTPMPLNEAGAKVTGTVHEFETFYSRWKETGGRRPQILFYFKQEPFFPRDRDDLAQWDGVFDFKEKFPAAGFSWNFGDVREFETLVRNHLAMALVKKYGSTFAKGVAIVESKGEMSKARLEIIAKAEKYLLSTGSRSHDDSYFEAIEKKLKEDPALPYDRVLFGPPRHRSLKDHLIRLTASRAGGETGLDAQDSLSISMFERADLQAEVSICANETQGLVVLPSFSGSAMFDSAIIFTEPERLTALRDFVNWLKRRGKLILQPNELPVLDEIPVHQEDDEGKPAPSHP